MVRGRKEPDSYDHGEWVILEGEDTAARDGGGREVEPRPPGSALLKLFAAVIAILLGVIAFATITNPFLARRPWVGLSREPEILQGMTPGGTMKVRVTLNNSGERPALNLYVAARLEIGNPAALLRIECGSPGARSPRSVLFPNQRYSATVTTRQAITDATIASLLRNEKLVYLVGCAEYDDGIWWWHRQPRRTNFCKVFVPDSVGNLGLLGDFKDCPTGNSAD